MARSPAITPENPILENTRVIVSIGENFAVALAETLLRGHVPQNGYFFVERAVIHSHSYALDCGEGVSRAVGVKAF
jgi:hypothetical protein